MCVGGWAFCDGSASRQRVETINYVFSCLKKKSLSDVKRYEKSFKREHEVLNLHDVDKTQKLNLQRKKPEKT